MPDYKNDCHPEDQTRVSLVFEASVLHVSHQGPHLVEYTDSTLVHVSVTFTCVGL